MFSVLSLTELVSWHSGWHDDCVGQALQAIITTTGTIALPALYSQEASAPGARCFAHASAVDDLVFIKFPCTPCTLCEITLKQGG